MKRRAERETPKPLPYRVVDPPIKTEFPQEDRLSTDEKIKSLNEKMNLVLLNQKRMLVVLRQLTAHPIDLLGPQDIKTDDSDLWTPQRFPLKELEQMETMEEDMNDPVKASVYLETMKDLLKPGGIFRTGGLPKNFHLLLSVDFMVKFNLDGIHHKIPLRKYTNFCKALYAILKHGEAYVRDDFISEVRLTFRAYKNRNNKRVSTVRRKMKLAEAQMEPELDFEKIICSENTEFVDEYD